MHPAIYVLAVTTFATATTEFGIVGIVPRIAAEFGLSLAESGRIVSVYALAMICGAVGINLVGRRFAVRRIIVVAILLFALANLFSALASDYAMLLVGRAWSGLSQGAVYGLGTAAAATIAERSHATRAVSVVFIGPTVAMVLGVPLAAIASIGHDWRIVFAVVGLVALASCAVLSRLMPETRGLAIVPARQMTGLAGNRKLIAIYAVTILTFGGSTMAFTYFPTLIAQGGAGAGFYLTVFGFGTVVGNLLAGRVSDRAGYATAATLAIVGLIACLLLLPLALSWPAGLAPLVFFWGLFAFSLPPVLQTEAVMVARAEGLSAAASSLNTAAFNVGIGAAALLASLVVEAAGLPVIPLAGAGLALAGLVVALFLHRRAG
ncbi:MFS transporter [Pseudoxanthobacter sp.]|uniref:MFS transporter n=1 Tax=Pseudoxanthobacter sp. TaxID=1925742 RepID=UPI002FE1C342